MKTDGTYKSKNIMMYPDGKYRWVYELNLYKSSVIFSEILKVLGITLVIVMLLMGIISLMDGDGIMDTLKFLGEMGGIMLAIFIPLSIVAYLIYAYVTGGKYCVVFEMDEKGITHIQHPKDVKKTKLIGALTVLAGIAGGRPGIVGTGILAASRTAMHSAFGDVKTLEFLPKQHLIRVNETLSRNQVYAEEEDFAFVANYIKIRCRNAKVKGDDYTNMTQRQSAATEARDTVAAGMTGNVQNNVPRKALNNTTNTAPQFCSNCGAKMNHDSRFCPNCGAKV